VNHKELAQSCGRETNLPNFFSKFFLKVKAILLQMAFNDKFPPEKN
jgi:hypothetical protein